MLNNQTYEETVGGVFSKSGTLRLGQPWTNVNIAFKGVMHELRVYKDSLTLADLNNQVTFSTGCPSTCSTCPYDHLCLCPGALTTTLRNCSSCTGANCSSCTAPCLRSSGASMTTYSTTCVGGCQVCSVSTSTCDTCVASTVPDTATSPSTSCVCPAGATSSGSGSSLACFFCLPECLICSDASSCDTCPTVNHQLIAGRCTCKASYYAVGATCNVCPNWCASCTGPAVAYCSACKDSDASQAVPGTGSCSCSAGKYLQASGTCATCPQDCSECDNSQKCTQCSSSNASINSAGRCVCEDGYYYPSGSITCTLCFDDCATCDSSPVCLTCKAPLTNSASGCQCPSKTYKNGSVCLNCAPGCAECSGASDCSQCESPDAEFTGVACECKAKHIQTSSSL
jgi:proprotein convertase subtilisin/kexin type 5